VRHSGERATFGDGDPDEQQMIRRTPSPSAAHARAMVTCSCGRAIIREPCRLGWLSFTKKKNKERKEKLDDEWSWMQPLCK
jgi:hypothetical protein